jgi:predicted RNA binding protein YcfA (HicA-like mRNA interferase family)
LGKYTKIIEKILSGSQDGNINFAELINLLLRLGFSMRIKGSHHILYRPDVNEIINIQANGANAKPYQVKQIRGIILKYKLGVKDG